MHLSSSDPYPSPQRRGSTHTAMFSRQLSSLKSDDVILPGVGKTDAFGSKDNNDNSSPSIKIAAKPTTGGLAAKLRPTGRLKSVVRKISVVNELSKMKDVNDDRKLVHGDVLPPPKCLGKYFQQAKKEERRYRLDESQRKAMNSRLVNSLFLRHINAEEVYSSVQNIEYEEEQEKELQREHQQQYKDYDHVFLSDADNSNTNSKFKLKTVKKYDKHQDRFVLHLKGVIHEEKKETIIVDEIKEYTRNSALRSSMLMNKPPANLRASMFMPDQPTEPIIERKEYVINSAEDERAVLEKYGYKKNYFSQPKDKKAVEEEKGDKEAPPSQEENGESKTDKEEVIESSIFNLQKIASYHDPNRYGGLPYIVDLQGKDIFITEELASRYFGDAARITFFEQYRKMTYNRLNIAPMVSSSASGILSASTSQLLLSQAETEGSTTWMENQSASLGDFRYRWEEGSSNGSQSAPLSVNSQQPSSSLARQQQFTASAVLMNPHFFDELQTISSNDHLKQKIDYEILSKASFGQYDNIRSATLQRKQQQKYQQKQSKKVNKKVAGGRGKVRLAPLPGTSSSVKSKSMTSLATKESWDILSEPLPASPRTKYLSCCIRESMKPLPNILIRKEYTTILDLSHFGMGDEMGKILAECLRSIPFIESINLNDNNLTDASLQYLIESIIAIPTLKVLNLSRNKIDGYSAEALSEYVSRPDCPLITLTLQNADVDDEECCNFVQTLVSNEQLLELDLASNLLGSSESLSTVDPDTKTGGEAIAEYIESSKCRLKILKLAWNTIRLKSAWRLMSAISLNHTITYLDLNNNGLGSRAGEILGDALMENRTLKTLLVNNNSFTSTACISLCIGVIENMALKQLEINENPIGIVGAKMIMQISMGLGTRVHLSAKNCNTVTVDSNCWYDPSFPYGDFTLRLHEPFERAIAFHLLQVIASHATYIFDYFYYEPAGGKGRKEKLQLVQSIAKDREQFLNTEQKAYLHGLKLIYQASTNLKLAEQLFYEADEDESGKLDKYELQNVLEKIGFQIDFDHLQDLFMLFDIDGTGMIDLPEFLALLKSQQRETLLRMKELTEYPMMALDSSPQIKYVPPKTGTITCKIIDGFIQKQKFYTMSSLDNKYALNMAKGIGDISLLSEAVKHNKIRYNEALQMFKQIYKEGERNKSKILLKLLPQMMYTTEAIQLISKVTNDHYLELQRIKLTFGISLKPLLGLFNGYYVLDLSKEIHRICLSRLLEQSQNVNVRRQQQSIIRSGKVGDTSQHQNWTCFRNEVYEGKKIEITAQRFTPMPHQGILSFDFSSCQRPALAGELTVTDKRLCKVLNNLCLLKTDRFEEGLRMLGEMKARCLQTSRDGKLFMPVYAFTPEKALEVGRALDDFYDHVESREAINRQGMKKEEVKVQVNRDIERPNTEQSELQDDFDSVRQMMLQKQSQDDHSSVEGEEDVSMMESTEENTLAENNVAAENVLDIASRSLSNEENTEEDDHTMMTGEEAFGVTLEGAEEEGESQAEQEEKEEEEEEDAEVIDETKELTAEQQIKIRKRRIREQKHRLYSLLHARGVSLHAKAIRFVEVIDETFNRLWIYSRHLALILQLFQQLFPPQIMRTDYFGSYSAEIVINLFPRVIDLHNIELIYEYLSAKDCAAVFARIGILNLFNPLKPEVTLETCLSRTEERMIAKIIIYLSVLEPGINLIYKRFQWKRELDPTPGWEVTDAMFTETGLHNHGYFAFTYYSGEGKNKMGCIPEILARRALCQMVLLDENEVYANDCLFDRDDDEFTRNHQPKGLPSDAVPEYVNSGTRHYRENQDLWLSYLTVNPTEKGGGSSSSVVSSHNND